MIGNCIKINDYGGKAIMMPSTNIFAPTQLDGGNRGDYDEQWYIDNVKYILSFYNTPTNNVNDPSYGNVLSQSPVTRMMRNLDYIIGEQSFGGYGSVATETPNSHFFFRKNRKIATIVDKMIGASSERVSRAIIGADPLSPDAKTERLNRINLEMFKFMAKPLVKNNKGFVVQNTEKEFKTPQEVEDWGEKSIKEHLAECYISIAENQWQQQSLADKSEFIMRDALAAGIAGVECVVDNGHNRVVWHPCYNIIFDNRRDQRYGEESRFAGVCYNSTLTELFGRMPFLSQEVKEDLNKIYQSPGIVAQMNVLVPGTSFWTSNPTTPPQYKDTALSSWRTYWISPTAEDPSINGLYTAEIIGNKYMVNFGRCDNVVNWVNKTYQPMLPVLIWTPSMLKGNLNALLSRITELSDEYELYRAKIRQLVSRTRGNCMMMMGVEAGANDTEKDVIDDLTDLGIHVFTMTGDPRVDNMEKIKMYNITNDAAIQGLINLNAMVNEEIEAFANQSKASLGEQTKYVGSKTFSGNLEQSSLGTVNLYDGLMNYLSIILRYQTNVTKNLYASGELSWEAAMVLGDNNLELMKQTEHQYAEDYLINLTLKDNIPDSRRESLEKIMMAAMQQPTVLQSLKSIVKVINAKTYTEAMEELDALADKLIEQEEQQRREEQEISLRQQGSAQEHDKEMKIADLTARKVKDDTSTSLKEQKLGLDERKVAIEEAKVGLTP